MVDWNRAPNNYDKIALVIRQIRASQDRVQRLRMIVPVWRCDAEAPVALLPPAPLRPLSVTSLTSRWTTGPTGAGAAPCTNPTSFPLSFSSWGGEARARGLAGWLLAYCSQISNGPLTSTQLQGQRSFCCPASPALAWRAPAPPPLATYSPPQRAARLVCLHCDVLWRRSASLRARSVTRPSGGWLIRISLRCTYVACTALPTLVRRTAQRRN